MSNPHQQLLKDAIRLLRESAEDETDYAVEIAGQLETYIVPLLESEEL